MLGGVERVVSALQQALQRIVPLAGHRDADADRDRQRVALSLQGEGPVGHRDAQTLGDEHRLAEAGLGHYHDKLLAAQATDQVDAAHLAHRALGEFAQDLVAGRVAMTVIDLLEMIDVEEHHRGLVAALGPASEQLVQMREDVAAIVEPGQFVGQRQGQAAAVICAQPLGQAFAADLGAHPRQELVAIDRTDQVIVGAEIEPLGEPRQLAVIGHQQDRQLARAFVRPPLRHQTQRVAIRHRQAGDDQLDRIVQRLCASAQEEARTTEAATGPSVSAVCPPIVGKSAKPPGRTLRSFSMILATISGVIGSI